MCGEGGGGGVERDLATGDIDDFDAGQGLHGCRLGGAREIAVPELQSQGKGRARWGQKDGAERRYSRLESGHSICRAAHIVGRRQSQLPHTMHEGTRESSARARACLHTWPHDPWP